MKTAAIAIAALSQTACTFAQGASSPALRGSVQTGNLDLKGTAFAGAFGGSEESSNRVLRGGGVEKEVVEGKNDKDQVKRRKKPKKPKKNDETRGRDLEGQEAPEE